MSTSKRPSRIAFRSKPISRRPTQPKQCDTETWRPTGPFRFLDLPSELRYDVLKLAIRHVRRQHRIINLLLVCQQIFHEVASIYYRDTTIDLTRAQISVEQLDQVLAGVSGSKSSLWRYIHSLILKLYLVDHLHLLPGSFSPALQGMSQNWNLRRLRIHIESKFPSDDFFGSAAPGSDSANEDDGDDTDGNAPRNGDSDLWKYHHLITGSTKRSKGNEPEIYAPLFLTTKPFQDFLRFLYLCRIPELSIHVDAHDHHAFWCIAHKGASKLKEISPSHCVAEGSRESYVEIDGKELIRIYGGARLP